jgi:signal transduction histidine kinase
MLKEIPGPLTDDQKRFLEIIKHNAEQLNRHFSIVMHNQHYLAWEQEAFPGQCNLRDMISDLDEILKQFPHLTLVVDVADDTLPVWVDQRHLHNAFASIVEFANQVYDERKTHELIFRAFHKEGFVTLTVTFDKKPSLSKKELSYFESFLFIARRVTELHNGNFALVNDPPETLSVTIVLPNIPKLTSK